MGQISRKSSAEASETHTLFLKLCSGRKQITLNFLLWIIHYASKDVQPSTGSGSSSVERKACSSVCPHWESRILQPCNTKGWRLLPVKHIPALQTPAWGRNFSKSFTVRYHLSAQRQPMLCLLFSGQSVSLTDPSPGLGLKDALLDPCCRVSHTAWLGDKNLHLSYFLLPSLAFLLALSYWGAQRRKKTFYWNFCSKLLGTGRGEQSFLRAGWTEPLGIRSMEQLLSNHRCIQFSK